MTAPLLFYANKFLLGEISFFLYYLQAYLLIVSLVEDQREIYAFLFSAINDFNYHFKTENTKSNNFYLDWNEV